MADERLVFQLRAEHQRLAADYKKAIGHTKNMSRQMSSTSKKVSASLTNMFGVFTAGMIARDIFNTVAQFEKQMDKVQAISGASADEINKLSDSAVQLGKKSKFTALEIGQLQEELARLGFSTEQITASTDAIRKLATAADSELSEAAKTVAATINSFNLEAKDAEEVSNIMAESFSKSALNLEKFSVGMANVGAQANAAGVSLSQTTAMLGILNNAGIDASKAGTDLRKIFTELAVNGMTLEDALSQIRSSTNKVKTAFDLFGQRAQTSAIILAENEQAVAALNSKLSDSNKELNKMVDIMEDNLLTDLLKLKSAWDGFILSLEKGDGVLSSAFRKVTQDLTGLLNALSSDKVNVFLKALALINPALAGNISKIAEAREELEKRKEATEEATSATNTQTLAERQAAEATRIRNIALRQQTELFRKISKSAPDLSSMGVDAPQPLSNTELGAGVFSGKQSLNHDYYEEVREKMQRDSDRFKAFLKNQADELNAIINQTIGTAISNGISTAINTGSIEEAFAAFLDTIGDGLQRFGKALLAFGIALEAFKSAPPGVKIAAGIAAIAAGAVVKKAASSLAASSASGIGGGSSSGRSGFEGSITGQTVTVNVQGQLTGRGRDFIGIIRNEEKHGTRLRGS